MVKILRIVDKYAGYIIVFFMSVFRIFDCRKQEKQKFLVIKLWAIGDSVLTLSLIKGLRKSFKECTIDVLILNRVKDVYECYHTDRIFCMDSFTDQMNLIRRFRGYDLVFDCEPYFNLSAILAFLLGKERIGFSGQFRSLLYSKKITFRKDQHMVQNYLDMIRILGKKYDTTVLEKLSVGIKDKSKVDAFVAENFHNKTIVGITPGVAETSQNRMWYEERFAELSDRIIALLNCSVILIDGPDNKDIVNRIMSLMKQRAVNSQGLFTLKENFYLISKCSVFISNDTGPMHVAAAQGCRTIGLFGPNTPVLWGPYGKGNTAIYLTNLKPAIENDKGIFREGNREGYMGCITVEDVFEAVKECLG